MIKLSDILREVEGPNVGNKEAVLKALQHRIDTTYTQTAEGKSLAKIKREIESLEGQELINKLIEMRRAALAAKQWSKTFILTKLEDIALGKI